LDVDTVASTQVRGVPCEGLVHPKRSVTGTDGVVLVGEGSPEERHDPVPHDLVDRPLVPVDRLHHPLEDRVDQLPGFLGIAVGQELHRALHIGEEHGDLLPLAFERGFRRQDFLGEVLGGVGPGRRKRAGGGRGHGLAAGGAERGAGRKRGAAPGADADESRPARHAEPRGRWVVLPAPGTLHAGPSATG
jgi:hypothetical protein